MPPQFLSEDAHLTWSRSARRPRRSVARGRSPAARCGRAPVRRQPARALEPVLAWAHMPHGPGDLLNAEIGPPDAYCHLHHVLRVATALWAGEGQRFAAPGWYNDDLRPTTD